MLSKLRVFKCFESRVLKSAAFPTALGYWWLFRQRRNKSPLISLSSQLVFALLTFFFCSSAASFLHTGHIVEASNISPHFTRDLYDTSSQYSRHLEFPNDSIESFRHTPSDMMSANNSKSGSAGGGKAVPSNASSMTSSNPSLLLDKFAGRRSTPDSEALASSDDENERQDHPQPAAPAQKPTRRASWLLEAWYRAFPGLRSRPPPPSPPPA